MVSGWARSSNSIPKRSRGGHRGPSARGVRPSQRAQRPARRARRRSVGEGVLGGVGGQVAVALVDLAGRDLVVPCPGGRAVGRSPRHPPGGDVGVRRRGVVGGSGAVATKAPAYLDEHFAELAPMATVSQLRVLVRAARPAPPRPPVPDDEPAESLSGWFDDDGRYHVRGEFDPDHGRIIESALTEARDALFQAGQTNVSWAEAMVEMARRSMDAAPTLRQERFRANWFIDPADPIPARWSDGLAVPSGCATCCSATAPCHRCSPTAPCRSASDAPNTRCPTAPAGWCCNATRSAGSRGAHKPGGCTSTTSSTTNTAARPTPATWAALPGLPPAAPQGPARDRRQRRRPQRAHLHRRQRPSDRPRRPPDQTHRATTETGHTLRAPTRRTPPEVGHLVPRPTTRATTGVYIRSRCERLRLAPVGVHLTSSISAVRRCVGGSRAHRPPRTAW